MFIFYYFASKLVLEHEGVCMSETPE